MKTLKIFLFSSLLATFALVAFPIASAQAAGDSWQPVCANCGCSGNEENKGCDCGKECNCEKNCQGDCNCEQKCEKDCNCKPEKKP